MSYLRIREIAEESIDQIDRDHKTMTKDDELAIAYVRGLKDAYGYILDMCKILEAKKQEAIVTDECDG